MNGGGRVYSYLRFSDNRQAVGSSIDRQMEYARRWAAERGFELDESLTMRDEGLSAYHQRHIKQGALGVFLLAVDEGRIASGSVLIVEGLDRLSRAEPIQAQAQLAQIINAGITVVTASDGREYNRASLKAQPMDLVYSLLVMIRAHEESDTKSKRVKLSIKRLCDGWMAGTYRGVIRNGKDPQWLELVDGKWELIPDRVLAVREALRLFEAGNGAVRVMRELKAQGLRFTNQDSSATQLYRLIRLPALVGIKRIEVEGHEYMLPDYYPPLLSQAEFDRLQVRVDARQSRKGRGEIPSLFTGMNMARCGYCGSSLAAQNYTSRTRADGSLLDGHRRIICSGYSHRADCVAGSVTIVPLERALMDYCSDQFNLTSLLQGPDPAAALRAQVAAGRSAVQATEEQLARVTEALLSDDGPAPLVFVRKARELEEQLGRDRAKLLQSEQSLSAVASIKEPALAEVWRELAEGVRNLDQDARMQARRLVADTFRRIVVYTKGVDQEGKHLDMLLVPRGGQSRLLRIDNRTGAWAHAAEFTTPAGLAPSEG